MKQLDCEILENKKISADFYRMRIGSSYLAANIAPGQFIEVRTSDSFEPFLRRPFSAHRILNSSVELLYEVVGKSTKEISSKKAGERLDVIGPLGNGFKINKSQSHKVTRSQVRNGRAILIAGGVGVAPLLALAEELAYSVERIGHRKKIKTYVLIGAKSKSHILCESDFKKIGCEVLVSTEDGSKGKRGLITDVLKDLIYAKRYPLNATIYTCGPVGMLKAVARIAKDKEAHCQVSLEERMACGVGVCLGCPVKTVSGYKMVCKDGPVFNAEEIKW